MTVKTLILAAAASVTLAGAASADSYFSFNDRVDASSTIELGTVRADANGIVEIYDNHGGAQGKLLGTQKVAAGANYDVRVNVGVRPINDVVAVLKINGATAAEQELDVN